MRSYIFPNIVMITALALAAGAALFTVLGFRELFEPSLKITYMAATIEFGKIIAVSALYQFRDILAWYWKTLMLSMILVAMAVTSMGVYGYLSSSFQKDTLSITQNESRLELLDARKSALTERLANMDKQIANVPESYVSKRMELIQTFKPERDLVLTEINELDEQKLTLTLERIDSETEFGAIILLAKSVEWLDENQAMLYFILAVIIIFDPLAIVLTYAANVGYANAAKSKEEAEQTTELEFGDIIPADNGELLGEIKSILDENKNDADSAISSVAEAVTKVSEEVTNLKNQEPAPNPRADVIDSMRKA